MPGASLLTLGQGGTCTKKGGTSTFSLYLRTVNILRAERKLDRRLLPIPQQIMQEVDVQCELLWSALSGGLSIFTLPWFRFVDTDPVHSIEL